VATTYLPTRDGRGIHLKRGDTVRFKDSAGRRTVGWVDDLTEGRVRVKYPKILVPVVDEDGSPVGADRAPLVPEWDMKTFLATEVEKWG